MVYMDQLMEGVMDYIKENVNLADYANRNHLESDLYDQCVNEDDITGSMSGSFYCNATQAKESVLLNGMSYFLEAIDEMGMSAEEVGTMFIKQDWESADVIIRCYLLPRAISEVLDQMEANGELEFGKED